MRVTINGEVNLEVEMSADVSSSENAHDLKVTCRVNVNNMWVDVDITSALYKSDITQALTAIEDSYRESKKDKSNFGRGA